MSADLNELYQRLILDHNKAPRNFAKLPTANRSGEGHNPSCGDRFTIFVRLENDIIREITFQGSGCALSKASASMMTESVRGKTVAEVNTLFDRFQNAVKTGKADVAELADLSVFSVMRRFPMRTKCALLPWEGLVASLRSGDITPAST